MFKKQITFLLILVFLLITNSLYAENSGKIKGMVVDGETGEPLIGANVTLLETSYGTMTDIDGNFTLEVPAEDYTLQATYIGYKPLKVTDIKVESRKISELNIKLHSEALDLGYQVEVTAKALNSSEAGLLKLQQKSDKVTDGISAEVISKTGASDAGDAVKRVTGITVVGGKYTYIRGLGGRYSNTMLNGSNVPSPEPNQSIVPMDIFPAGLLENLQIAKTFTPDQPGNFAGGSVQIETKEFPDDLTLNFSTSAGFNSATFGDFYSYKGGSTDFLGIDDGTRGLPDIIESKASDKFVRKGPNFSEEDIVEFGRSFENIWSPKIKTAPINQSYSFTLGNELNLFDKDLGYILALNYSNKFDQTEKEKNTYTRSGNKFVKSNDYDFTTGKNSILWGAIFNTSLRLSSLHKLGIKTIYNRSADDEATIYEGYNYDRNNDTRNYRLRYIERDLLSTQLSGAHHFYEILDSDIEWKLTYSKVNRNEPDNREVFYEYNSTYDDYYITTNQTRSFFELEEDNKSAGLDWTIPFKTQGLKSKFKFGGLYRNKERDFFARRFYFQCRNSGEQDLINIYGEPEDIFAPENIYFPTSINSYDYVEFSEFTDKLDSYTATHEVTAGYAMLDMFLPMNLRLIGGVRVENSKQELEIVDKLGQATAPSTLPSASLDNRDLLPSVNLVYALNERSNLRTAYTRTLARPDFREIAPYGYKMFNGGYTEIGNPDLKRTLIDNFDLRYEIFPAPGELIAASLFYKHFTNPIERAFKPGQELMITWQNAESANSFGFELEGRKPLGFISPKLNNFNFNSNFTWMWTEVKVESAGGETTDSRALEGQSPYVVNAMLAYDNLSKGTFVNLVFNIFGRRITELGYMDYPEVYEESRPQLDLLVKQKITNNLRAKFSVKNILDPYVEFTQDDEPTEKYKKGRSFSIGLSYSL